MTKNNSYSWWLRNIFKSKSSNDFLKYSRAIVAIKRFAIGARILIYINMILLWYYNIILGENNSTQTSFYSS